MSERESWRASWARMRAAADALKAQWGEEWTRMEEERAIILDAIELGETIVDAGDETADDAWKAYAIDLDELDRDERDHPSDDTCEGDNVQVGTLEQGGRMETGASRQPLDFSSSAALAGAFFVSFLRVIWYN